MARVLELGTYIAGAYAGMLLAEQGHQVSKFWLGDDPVLGLKHGPELWEWLNEHKSMHLVDVRHGLSDVLGDFDAVVDNIRPETWASWGIDPAALAREHFIPWVSLRSDVPGRSFDVVAQARSWMSVGVPWVPMYVGDTSAGLWLAFKLSSMLAADEIGHVSLYQASLLTKLIEGELRLDLDRVDELGAPATAFDTETYRADVVTGAHVAYRGDMIREPVRDYAWRWQHLHHDGTGRIVV